MLNVDDRMMLGSFGTGYVFSINNLTAFNGLGVNWNKLKQKIEAINNIENKQH